MVIIIIIGNRNISIRIRLAEERDNVILIIIMHRYIMHVGSYVRTYSNIIYTLRRAKYSSKLHVLLMVYNMVNIGIPSGV